MYPFCMNELSLVFDEPRNVILPISEIFSIDLLGIAAYISTNGQLESINYLKLLYTTCHTSSYYYKDKLPFYMLFVA